VKLSARTRTTLSWSLWLITVGCCAAFLAVTLVVIRPLTLAVVADAVFSLVFLLGYATVGLVVTLRRPANPIGWLYAAVGLIAALTVPLAPWLDWLVQTGRPLPLAAQLQAIADLLVWAPAIALGVTLPALLLPDGRLRSRRWRVVVATAVTGPVLFMVGGLLLPGPVGPEAPVRFDNPFGLSGVAGRVAAVVLNIGLVLHWASLPAAAVCVVLRFRASRGVERQQLRWAAAGAAGAVAGLLLTLPGAWGLLPQATTFVLYPALLCPPVSVAVAVLRYRLWDLDRLISRTLAWVLVTGLLILPYLLILPAVTRLAGDAGSLAVAAATLAAAAAFQPLRRCVQDLVDRRFNRRRYDAARTVEGFAARLREQVDLDVLSAELLAVVERTVQPARASLWLRPPVTPRPPRSTVITGQHDSHLSTQHPRPG
jgi:hypothetical protein